MLRVLTSNNTAIFRELGSPPFQSIGVEHAIVSSGSEALDRVRRERPELVILDAELPELSGRDVCRAIKNDATLRETRVILLVGAGPSSTGSARYADSGCDDVMTVTDELYEHAARLLPLSATPRSHVRAQVLTRGGLGSPVRGEAVGIAPAGLELTVDHPVPTGTAVRVRLARVGARQALLVNGRVCGCQEAGAASHACTLRVDLDPLDPEDEATLLDLALWELSDGGDALHVILRGDIGEKADFATLAGQLGARELVFDLGGVRSMSAAGVDAWIAFLEELDADCSYSFVRCSPAFVQVLADEPRASGRGAVVSVVASLRCPRCDREGEWVLAARDLPLAGVACAGCGVSLVPSRGEARDEQVTQQAG